MESLLLGRKLEQYKDLKAEHTAKEILQQPQLWQGILEVLESQTEPISRFLQKHLSSQTKVVFAGAGTSEFVGNTVVPYLQSVGCRNFFSIASTDLTSSPSSYLAAEDEILLVSCARSGNSPESLAAAQLIDAYVQRSAHVLLCCNPQGELAQHHQNQDNAFTLILEGAHDLGFAMTGSFTSMVLAAIMIFQGSAQRARAYFLRVATMIAELTEDMIELCQLGKQRIICLGSAYMKGIAQEAHLKILELSAGKHTAHCSSSLDFRHGFKSLLNDQSLVLFFMNEAAYTWQYEYDLLEEMYQNAGKHYLVAISPEGREFPQRCYHKLLRLPQAGSSYLYALSAIIIAQLFALENAIQLQVHPDNPSPSGLVNRVVQGVKIYPHPCQKPLE